MVERGGNVKAIVVKDTTKATLHPIIAENIAAGSKVYTDDWKGYKGLKATYTHGSVNHTKGIYVNGDVHTNTIEGFWSLLKRGIVGIYHSVSPKHLNKYVDEFEFRYNTRNFGEAQRFEKMISMSEVRLTYKQLIHG